MLSIAHELELYRDYAKDTIYLSADGRQLSHRLGDVLRRQLVVLQRRFSAESLERQYIDGCLEVNLHDDQEWETQAEVMIFVLMQVYEWLSAYLATPRRLVTIKMLAEDTTAEFGFDCQFDACIVLHAIANSGMMLDAYQVSAN